MNRFSSALLKLIFAILITITEISGKSGDTLLDYHSSKSLSWLFRHHDLIICAGNRTIGTPAITKKIA
jgi:hypothetical protein